MNTLYTILASILTSSVVVGTLLFIVKKYISEAISHEFQKRAENDSVLRKKEIMRDNAFFESRFGIYPELAEVTYRIKNILSKLTEAKYAYEYSIELSELSAQLTEFLFRYRFFLSGNLFSLLHDFKRISQDTAMLLDIFTRDETVFNSENFKSQQSKLNDTAAQSELIYQKILAELNNIGVHHDSKGI
jgi:hypothetical protein